VRVLLDENIPHRLRNKLTGYDAVTAAYAGLSGFKNGQLLRAAVRAGFDVLVTADKTLEYEQNIPNHPIGVVLLSTNLWQFIGPKALEIAAAIGKITPGQIVRVDWGTFSRRRPG
jgi:hypothetical protein